MKRRSGPLWAFKIGHKSVESITDGGQFTAHQFPDSKINHSHLNSAVIQKQGGPLYRLDGSIKCSMTIRMNEVIAIPRLKFKASIHDLSAQ